MEDIIQFNNEFYLKASSTLADQRNRVLKQGELFAIYDVFGDLKQVGTAAQGLYYESTRFLSQMELRVGGRHPLYLSSAINADNSVLTVDLSNSDMEDPKGDRIPRGTFHILRTKFLSEPCAYERIQITNFSQETRELDLSLRFQCDFVDMFEIRGIPREKRGTISPPTVDSESVQYTYTGLDQKVRVCKIQFYPRPTLLTAQEVRYALETNPGGRAALFITVSCSLDESTPNTQTYHGALANVERWNRQIRFHGCGIHSSSSLFDHWINRSRSDVCLMETQTPSGRYPYAGIPWFNTVFGRDGIITALEYLWVNPQVARGVLSYLSRNQARENQPENDAEPGKILHEFRKGEMVDTGEVAFKNYFGSVDATPLFICLAGAYLERTGDVAFIRELWPSVEAALNWIDKFGDLDKDGFVEYQRRSKKGLQNQGWKDSSDCIVHADGSLASGPISLCEVQGYVYEAKIQAARMSGILGFGPQSLELNAQAEKLKTQFQKKFWIEELGTFALALDGKKNPCAVKSSNGGQCLFSKIATPEQASRLAQTLFSREMHSGWGIRTLSQEEIRYNPMSYHNGSVWPHDNALIAEGLASYGHKERVLQLMDNFYHAATQVDLYRLPELFCGFSRRSGEGPTLYPVACSPQAWAAASAFMFLKACLGLSIDSLNNKIVFSYPVLPRFLMDLSITNLETATGSVNLSFRRHGEDASLYVDKRIGNVEVVVIK